MAEPPESSDVASRHPVRRLRWATSKVSWSSTARGRVPGSRASRPVSVKECSGPGTDPGSAAPRPAPKPPSARRSPRESLRTPRERPGGGATGSPHRSERRSCSPSLALTSLPRLGASACAERYSALSKPSITRSRWRPPAAQGRPAVNCQASVRSRASPPSRLGLRLVGRRSASGRIVSRIPAELAEIAVATGARLPIRCPLVRRIQLEAGCDRCSELVVVGQLTDRLDSGAGGAPAGIRTILVLVGRLRRRVPVRGFRVGRGVVRLADVAVVAWARDPGRRVAVADLGVGLAAARLLQTQLQREGECPRALPVLRGLADGLDPRPTASALLSALLLDGVLTRPVGCCRRRRSRTRCSIGTPSRRIRGSEPARARSRSRRRVAQ